MLGSLYVQFKKADLTEETTDEAVLHPLLRLTATDGSTRHFTWAYAVKRPDASGKERQTNKNLLLIAVLKALGFQEDDNPDDHSTHRFFFAPATDFQTDPDDPTSSTLTSALFTSTSFPTDFSSSGLITLIQPRTSHLELATNKSWSRLDQPTSIKCFSISRRTYDLTPLTRSDKQAVPRFEADLTLKGSERSGDLIKTTLEASDLHFYEPSSKFSFLHGGGWGDQLGVEIDGSTPAPLIPNDCRDPDHHRRMILRPEPDARALSLAFDLDEDRVLAHL